jgi:hypothetical protein
LRPTFTEIVARYFDSNAWQQLSSPAMPSHPDPWLYEHITDRVEAESLLSRANADVFMIRGSSQPGCFSLSMWDNSKRQCSHVLIKTEGNKLMLTDSRAKLYDNIDDLVDDIHTRYPNFKGVGEVVK